MVTNEEKQGPGLLEQVRIAIRARHYSRRTEKAYVSWTRRFVMYHGKRHPAEMGADEVTAFLSHLATERRVSASTQNQALSALLFLYREVLRLELPWLDGIVRARQPKRLPVVLTRQEVQAVLEHLHGLAAAPNAHMSAGSNVSCAFTACSTRLK